MVLAGLVYSDRLVLLQHIKELSYCPITDIGCVMNGPSAKNKLTLLYIHTLAITDERISLEQKMNPKMKHFGIIEMLPVFNLSVEFDPIGLTLVAANRLKQVEIHNRYDGALIVGFNGNIISHNQALYTVSYALQRYAS